MTGGVEVDLDRLADFVGGALDGTPDAADVRHLIETDPRWAEAHATLVVADAAMREQLGAWGAEPEPMPDDVRSRIDAALTAAAVRPVTPPVVRDELRDRRQRRQRWMVGLATAAAILACGVGGVAVIQQGREGRDTGTATSVRDNGAPAAPSPQAVAPGSGSRASGGLLASGRDYSPETLGELGALSAAPGAKAAPNENFQADSAVPNPLQRLAEPTARAACLDAITAEYGGQVSVVDFARFEGSPALVVVVDGARIAPGKRLVVVVGPTCGTGNAIADERYRTTI